MVPLKLRLLEIDERTDFYNVAGQLVNAADAIDLEIVAGTYDGNTNHIPFPHDREACQRLARNDPARKCQATMCMTSSMVEPYSAADHKYFHATNPRRCLGKVQKLVVCHAHQC